jgi:hypothetical protein
MLVVLVLSVAAAWMVAFPRQRAYRHAVEMLHSFDAGTLSSYWSAHEESWFIAYDVAGRAIGWEGTFLRTSGNSFTGGTFTRLPDFADQEEWKVSGDLKTTDYAETFPHYSVHSQDGMISVKAAIQLSNGLRKVVALPGDGRSERVENYLPPFLIELAVARVAKTQQAATFAIVDSSPFAARQAVLRTLSLTIKPTGPHTVQTTIEGDPVVTMVYVLTNDGDVSEIQDLHNRITYKRASRQDVEKHFHDETLPAPMNPPAEKEETPASDAGEGDKVAV